VEGPFVSHVRWALVRAALGQGTHHKVRIGIPVVILGGLRHLRGGIASRRLPHVDDCTGRSTDLCMEESRRRGERHEHAVGTKGATRCARTVGANDEAKELGNQRDLPGEQAADELPGEHDMSVARSRGVRSSFSPVSRMHMDNNACPSNRYVLDRDEVNQSHVRFTTLYSLPHNPFSCPFVLFPLIAFHRSLRPRRAVHRVRCRRRRPRRSHSTSSFRSRGFSFAIILPDLLLRPPRASSSALSFAIVHVRVLARTHQHTTPSLLLSLLPLPHLPPPISPSSSSLSILLFVLLFVLFFALVLVRVLRPPSTVVHFLALHFRSIGLSLSPFLIVVSLLVFPFLLLRLPLVLLLVLFVLFGVRFGGALQRTHQQNSEWQNTAEYRQKRGRRATEAGGGGWNIGRIRQSLRQKRVSQRVKWVTPR